MANVGSSWSFLNFLPLPACRSFQTVRALRKMISSISCTQGRGTVGQFCKHVQNRQTGWWRVFQILPLPARIQVNMQCMESLVSDDVNTEVKITITELLRKCTLGWWRTWALHRCIRTGGLEWGVGSMEVIVGKSYCNCFRFNLVNSFGKCTPEQQLILHRIQWLWKLLWTVQASYMKEKVAVDWRALRTSKGKEKGRQARKKEQKI